MGSHTDRIALKGIGVGVGRYQPDRRCRLTICRYLEQKCDQILCEWIGVVRSGYSDGAIHDPRTDPWGSNGLDEHVAGVHVRVEEVVIKDLGKEVSTPL